MRSAFIFIRVLLCPIALALLLGTVFCLTNSPSALAAGPTVYVGPGETYQTLQQAINASTSGTIIVVRDGTYTENVNVNKRLTIRSQNGPGTTTVQASSSQDHVFEITADHVTLQGFTVAGATGSLRAGIYLAPGSDNGSILGNICGRDATNSNTLGIYLDGASNNNVSGNNVVYSRGHGIYLRNSSNNSVNANTVSNSADCGIYLEGSSNNSLPYNSVSNSAAGSGIALSDSSNVTVFSNTTRSNQNHGISLTNASDTVLSGNRVAENRESGIALDGSSNNQIFKNEISRNGTGISLTGSSENMISKNKVSDNNSGISLNNSNDNAIYLNNFTNNTSGHVASVGSSNAWSTPQIVNYQHNGSTYPGYLGNNWSGYNGKDDNNNGVGDSPYTVGDQTDAYPLMKSFEDYNIHPQANFSFAPATGDEPLGIQFFDESTSYDGITSWTWDFGDGTTATTSETNTLHQYAQNGTYTVSMTIHEADGDTNTATKTGCIIVLDTAPTANFSSDVVTGAEPLNVAFSDHSYSYDGIVSWSWDFGDDTTSDQQNPTHQYAQNGTYTVSLTVTEADGSTATETKASYIIVTDTAPTAEFAVDKTNVPEAQSVTFTDTSTSYDGVASWTWDFGDGTTSDQTNPTHVYRQQGTYTVALTVREADGNSHTITKENVMTVTDTAPIASFSATPVNGDDPLNVQFKDESTSNDTLVNWVWTFGDGGSSNQQNPVHIYQSPGTYAVMLTAYENDTNSNTVIKTTYITVFDTQPTADFSATPIDGPAPLSVTFADKSTSPHDGITSWKWDFGDGAFSSQKNPTHEYKQPGTYTVTLTVTEPDGNTAVKTTTVTVVAGTSNGDQGQGSSASLGQGDGSKDGKDGVAEETSTPAGSSGIPIWAWIVIAIAVLAIPTAFGGYFIKHKRATVPVEERWKKDGFFMDENSDD